MSREGADGSMYWMFSPGVENGSVQLPWGSATVTAQLDLFDVYTRELAQIMSVLGVEVNLKALMSIDMLGISRAEGADDSDSTPDHGRGRADSHGSGSGGGGGVNAGRGDDKGGHQLTRMMSTPPTSHADMRKKKIENALAKLVAAEILICIEVASSGGKARRPSLDGSLTSVPAKKKRVTYEWGFASSEVRAAVYTSMTFSVRQGIHKALQYYYRLAYAKDLRHFANIICYHAEAAGDIRSAVDTSFSATLEHMERKAYRDALDSLQRCIGLLENHVESEEDQELLAGCLMREAHLYTIMSQPQHALDSLVRTEAVCRHEFSFSRVPEAEGGQQKTGKKKSGTPRLFSCCAPSTLTRMRKVASKSIRTIEAAAMSASLLADQQAAAETCLPKLMKAYALALPPATVKQQLKQKEQLLHGQIANLAAENAGAHLTFSTRQKPEELKSTRSKRSTM